MKISKHAIHHRHSGFSIMQVLVAVGLMSLGFVILNQFSTMAFKTQANVTNRAEMDLLVSTVSMVAANDDFCKNAFVDEAGHNVLVQDSPAADANVYQIVLGDLASGGSKLVKIDDDLGSGLIIDRIYLRPIPPPGGPVTVTLVPPNPVTGTFKRVFAQVFIEGTKKTAAGPSRIKSPGIPVSFLTNNAGPNEDRIALCHVPKQGEINPPPPPGMPPPAGVPTSFVPRSIISGVIPKPKGCWGGGFTINVAFPAPAVAPAMPALFITAPAVPYPLSGRLTSSAIGDFPGFTTPPVVMAQPRWTADNSDEHSTWSVYNITTAGFTFGWQGPHGCGANGDNDIMWTAFGN